MIDLTKADLELIKEILLIVVFILTWFSENVKQDSRIGFLILALALILLAARWAAKIRIKDLPVEIPSEAKL